MTTRTKHDEPSAGTRIAWTGRSPDHGRRAATRLSTEDVWRALSEASFAVVGYVTPSGAPRSSGVVYQTVDRRLYVAVAPDSWKAQHIAAGGKVAVTVPVRRGGILSLVAPIPPATVSFHAAAIVRPPGAPEVRSLLEELTSLLPAERRDSASVIEISPEGAFLTYGLGVSLMKMRDPATARARVPVSDGRGTP
jgi:Pyridoxamine 5'-phosphate oxidase